MKLLKMSQNSLKDSHSLVLIVIDNNEDDLKFMPSQILSVSPFMKKRNTYVNLKVPPS